LIDQPGKAGKDEDGEEGKALHERPRG